LTIGLFFQSEKNWEEILTSESYITDILEKWRNAVEIVEAGAPRYKEQFGFRLPIYYTNHYTEK
jgi:hypothetical protein